MTFPLPVHHQLSVSEIADRLGECKIYNLNKDQIIKTVSPPNLAQQDSLIFIKNFSSGQSSLSWNHCAAAVVCDQRLTPRIHHSACEIVTADPLEWYIKALSHLFDLGRASSIASTSIIASTATIGSDVLIEDGVIVEDFCSIGDKSTIGANTILKTGTVIGENCFIQSNTTIGSTGLGYHISNDGERMLFPHLGNVLIGDSVIVGSSCVIVRGQLSDTILQSGVRVGNLVNIGHNVTIGSNTAISSSATVAGGARIGSNCNIAAGVVINAKVQIGDHCQIGLGSVVTKSLPKGESFFGNPARRLPTMRRF